MKRTRLFKILTAATVSFVFPVLFAVGEEYRIKNAYIPITRDMSGVLYEPIVTTEKSKISILVMHSDENYLNFSAGPELAKRGYRVLCANVVSADSSMEDKMLNVKSCVDYLKNYPGIEKILLLGHSGGATLMTAYQTIAENGVKSVQGPEKMVKISDAVANLTPADGVMLLDSNWGNAAMTLFSTDPAVVTEGNGVKLDPSLDLYNPINGFSKDGAVYSEEFKQKFLKAQAARYNALIKSAEERVAAIGSGKGNFTDDEPLVAAGAEQMAFNNKLYPQDIRLMAHTKTAWPLLHADGTITTEIVHSVRLPVTIKSDSSSYHMALVSTVRNFLSKDAVRVTDDYNITEDGVTGIDWTSNITCPPGNVQKIHVPLLLMGMTGSWEYLASETIYNNAANAKDKTLVFVEGATHMFTTNKQAEKIPGEFGDTMKTLYDYVDKWLSSNGRFLTKGRTV